jgi:hypothetical protein
MPPRALASVHQCLSGARRAPACTPPAYRLQSPPEWQPLPALPAADTPRKVSKSGYDVTPLTAEERAAAARELTDFQKYVWLCSSALHDSVRPLRVTNKLLWVALTGCLVLRCQSSAPQCPPLIVASGAAQRLCMHTLPARQVCDAGARNRAGLLWQDDERVLARQQEQGRVCVRAWRPAPLHE